MRSTQVQGMHAHPISFGWFQRSAASCVAGAGYLFGLFLVQRTLIGFLALTGIYSAWIVIYHLGRQRARVGWLPTLFCLACASLWIPLPPTSAYWLPILPTMTACLMMTNRPRVLSLLAAGALWLSTGLALGLLSQRWDAGGQVILLISFSSTCGCAAIISELAAAHAQLREYSVQVEELSIVRERNRIAREIHDTLGHSLTLLAVQLETATQHEMRGDPRLREELREARQVAKACLTDVRRSVEALRPDHASAQTLQEQLRVLVAASEAACPETSITLDLDEATHPLDADLHMTLYRCAQEALTNIRKHAHATKVLLRLSTTNQQVELTVLDNGQGGGSTRDQSAPGFGLLGMHERVDLLGGRLQAGAQARGGWRVDVMLPLAPRERAAFSVTGASKMKKDG